jgi:dTMP kinase
VSAGGALIAIEGIDGAGKTTLAAGLLKALPELVVLREPGGAELSERIRALVADPGLAVDERAEALLFAAARAQLVAEVVRPWLSRGRMVVLDRYVDSSLAYQGAGRGLGVEAVAAVNAFATGGLAADLVLYVRVEPEVGAARVGGDGDRIERAGAPFFRAVVDAYDALAAGEPERYVVLDGTGTPESVLSAALDAVKSLHSPR